MDLTTPAFVLMAITASASLFAAIAAFTSTRETRRTAQAQLFFPFLAEYGSQEMLWALRILRNWQSEYGQDFAKTWKERLDAADKNGLEVEEARHHVAHFFRRALRLRKAAYVSWAFVGHVCALDGFSVYLNVVEPLERALDPDFNTSDNDSMVRRFGIPRGGRLLHPVPVPSRRTGGGGATT